MHNFQYYVRRWLDRRAQAVGYWRFSKIIDYYVRHSFVPYTTHRNIEGVNFDFFVGEVSAERMYDPQRTMSGFPEMAFIRDHLLTQGDVVLECGAHHGFTGMFLSRWIGDGGKLYMFDPVPTNVEIIKKNIELNGRSNATVIQAAVGAARGKARIGVGSNTSVTPNAVAGLEVDVVTIDDYIDLNPSVVKIDVEGYEVQVLRGAKKVLSSLRPKLVMEIHRPETLGKYGCSVDDIFNELDLSGYKCWVQWEDHIAPTPYHFKQAIKNRVHLFAIPGER